jgi:hypothetical protein
MKSQCDEYQTKAMEFLVNICAPKPFIDCPQYRQTYKGGTYICLLMNPEDMPCSHEQVSVAMHISCKCIPSHDILVIIYAPKPFNDCPQYTQTYTG